MAVAGASKTVIHTWDWSWDSKLVKVCYETWGNADGEPLLLLPALSTVSSRNEMGAIAQQLLQQFPNKYQLIALDWPGFGDSDRLRLSYGPKLYQRFLLDFVTALFDRPITVVAAGHGASYVIALAAQNLWHKVVLVAPTWRGPLAVMGAPVGVRAGLEQLVRSPLVGQFLYGLNTRPDFLKWMYRRHVFVDAAKLTDEFIAQRHRGTQKTGARYAPAAFVTGGLDPVQERENFLAYFEGLSMPLLAIVAEKAPSSSKAEMEAIAALPQVQSQGLPGTLGMAEEYGPEVAVAISPFLAA